MSSIRSDRIDYSLWLAFDERGGVRMTRTEPSLDRSERAMQLTLTIPRTVFRTPQLRATIGVEDGAPAVGQIDVSAAASALREALGVDVDVRVIDQ